MIKGEEQLLKRNVVRKMNESTVLMMKEMKEMDGTKEVASSDRTEKVKIMMKTMQGGKVREQRRGHKGYRPCPRTHPDTRAQPHLRTNLLPMFLFGGGRGCNP